MDTHALFLISDGKFSPCSLQLLWAFTNDFVVLAKSLLFLVWWVAFSWKRVGLSQVIFLCLLRLGFVLYFINHGGFSPLLIGCVLLIASPLLNHSGIPQINSAWPWYIMFFIGFWANLLLFCWRFCGNIQEECCFLGVFFVFV